MKFFKQSAIALAVVGVAFSSMSLQAATEGVLDDDIDFTVTAHIDDYIQLVPQGSPNVNFGTYNNNHVGDWAAVQKYNVERRGASIHRAKGYTLTVTGPEASSGEHYSLSTDNGEMLKMNIDYLTNAGFFDSDTGRLSHGSATEELVTRRGLVPSSEDPDIENGLVRHNLRLAFTIPEGEIRRADSGTFEGEFNIMVAAI